MRRLIRLLFVAATALAYLFAAVSCLPAKKPERGVLSAENAIVGGRLYHAARISDTFQYIDINVDYKSVLTIVPKVACAIKGCSHSDDSCPAYIRGLTCWAPDPGAHSHSLWYAQMRTYFDAEQKKGVRHNVIACLAVLTGETETVLQDWQYPIDQLLLYGDDIYFLSKNQDGLHDIWVIPRSGGTPELYVAGDGIVMVGMENGALYFMSEDSGVYRAERGSDGVKTTLIFSCDTPTGIFVYDGYIYYPVKSEDAPEYEILPGRTETDENGEVTEFAVAVNCHDYYRVPVSGGEPEPVISGVQATVGSLCADGYLYLPAWEFDYYGSIESKGGSTDYFSRSSGTVWAVDIKGKPRADTLISASKYATADGDITAIYTVTERFVFAKSLNTLAAYQNGTPVESVYVLFDRGDGYVRVVNFE